MRYGEDPGFSQSFVVPGLVNAVARQKMVQSRSESFECNIGFRSGEIGIGYSQVRFMVECLRLDRSRFESVAENDIIVLWVMGHRYSLSQLTLR